MIEVLKDNNGELKGVCEFYAVDINGNWCDKGEYCWINELEFSESSKNKGYLKYFIDTITSKYPQFKYGYFWRKRKYENKPARIYSRRQWRNLLK